MNDMLVFKWAACLLNLHKGDIHGEKKLATVHVAHIDLAHHPKH